ncbi:MAG: hypothetical protein H8E24_13175 [Verrucomicrobia bacterium]|nr:hypothetical protein [Verrucomicrobiota bacterium]
MRIESGLFNSMVMQRDKNNLSDQLIIGEGSGEITIRGTYKGRALRGFSKIKVGHAIKGRFKGLPVGGPYKIDLSDDSDSSTVKDVLIGDVRTLAGQSNMEGIGNLNNRLWLAS